MSIPEPQHQKSDVLTREDLQEIYQKLESLENAKQQLEQKNQELSSEVQNVRKEMEHLKEQRAPGTPGEHTEDTEKEERPDPTQAPCSESAGTDQNAQEKQIEQLHQSLSSMQESNKQQQRRIDTLHHGMEQVEALQERLQDLHALVPDLSDKVTRLAEDMSAMGKTEKKAAAKKTKSNVSDVVEELRGEMEKMDADSKQKVENLRQQSDALVAKLTASLEEMRTEVKQQRDAMAELKNQHDSMQQSVERHLASISEEQRKLESEIKAGCQAVSFHATLGSDVTVTEQETLVCRDVVSNHGEGYDPGSGVFTCPAPGTYLFLATASPNQLDDNKAAALDVVVGDRVCGGLCAYGYHWATAHCVVEVQAGDTVKLRTLPGEYHFAGERWTSFTGLLLKTAL